MGGNVEDRKEKLNMKFRTVPILLFLIVVSGIFVWRNTLNNYELIIKRGKFFSSLYKTLPYFIVLFFFVVIRSLVIGQTAQTTYWAGGFIPQMLTMVKGFAYYVKLMFVPYPLSAEYLFDIKRTIDIEVLLYGLVLVGIIYLGWRLRKNQPLISFGIFLFFLSLAPVSNIVPIRTIINERFLYLAVVGWGLILSQAVLYLFGKMFFFPVGVNSNSPNYQTKHQQNSKSKTNFIHNSYSPLSSKIPRIKKSITRTRPIVNDTKGTLSGEIILPTTAAVKTIWLKLNNIFAKFSRCFFVSFTSLIITKFLNFVKQKISPVTPPALPLSFYHLLFIS